MTEPQLIRVAPEDAGQRLDKFLSSQLEDISRSRIQSLLEAGHILREENSPVTSASLKVKAGEGFLVSLPETEPSEILPVEMALDVVFEDEHLLVINKPAGLTVHPAPGHYQDTLVNALLAHCQGSLSGIGGVARPGIVHRIDKDTSGLLVVAKHDRAHHYLARQLQQRELKRYYDALCWGVPPHGEGTITGDIGRSPKDRKKMAIVKQGGKPATTHYAVQEAFRINMPMPGRKDVLQRVDVAAYLRCELETGRTHQIRVHLSHHHFPLIGDPVYGPDSAFRLRGGLGKALGAEHVEAICAFRRQALHAAELHLIHPETKEEMQFEAPLPYDFLMLLEALRNLQNI